MPQSYQDKIELLKKAREAKKAKYDAIKQEKIDNPPPKGRPRKETKKTLDITEPVEIQDEEIDEIIENLSLYSIIGTLLYVAIARSVSNPIITFPYFEAVLIIFKWPT